MGSQFSRVPTVYETRLRAERKLKKQQKREADAEQAKKRAKGKLKWKKDRPYNNLFAHQENLDWWYGRNCLFCRPNCRCSETCGYAIYGYKP